MVSGIASIIGLIVHIFWNHEYDFPICNMVNAIGFYFVREPHPLLDELLVLDAYYFSAMSVMILFYYNSEKEDRYMVFYNYKRHQGNKQYKKFLKMLPIGIAILGERNAKAIYSNKLIRKMFEGIAKGGNPTPCDKTEADKLKKDFNEEFSDVLKLLQEGSSGQNLLEFLAKENIDLESLDQRQFMYKGDSHDDPGKLYQIKFCAIQFKGAKRICIIAQDLTAYEKLSKLEETYQKLYVASIVHDLRTPLNGIMGMLEMISLSATTENEKLYISYAKNTCKILSFLTYDITDYSQIEAKKLKIVSTSQCPKDVIDECCQIFQFNYQKKGVALEKYIHGSVPPMLCFDKNRYMQILLNLLSNALKFTFRGGVKVALEYQSDKDLLLTHVQDSGIGIKPEDLPKLFRMFGKLEQENSINPQGVGFGLTICKKLAESLGGYIGVKSEYKKGTCFSFAIKGGLTTDYMILPETHSSQKDCSPCRPEIEYTPREIENKIGLHKFATIAKPNNNNRMSIEEVKEIMENDVKACFCPDILIVDDNEGNLFVFENYLKLANIAADKAANGQEALEKIVARSKKVCCQHYKLIFMDINMPIMDGIEATREIRRAYSKPGASPKIIALTAAQLRSDEETELMNVVGFTGYLMKPLSREMLMGTLRKYKIL